MNRGLYLFKSLAQHQKALKKLFKTPLLHATELTLETLQARGVRALVLDFDGVLASHGQQTLHPDILPWLTTLSQNSNIRLWILSNNPSPARQSFFATYFPAIGVITDVRKKPYPDGLLKIIQTYHYQPHELLMVDDRLLTGCLAALNAGTQAAWISKPYRQLRSRQFLLELYFSLLRTLDKMTLL